MPPMRTEVTELDRPTAVPLKAFATFACLNGIGGTINNVGALKQTTYKTILAL